MSGFKLTTVNVENCRIGSPESQPTQRLIQKSLIEVAKLGRNAIQKSAPLKPSFGEKLAPVESLSRKLVRNAEGEAVLKDTIRTTQSRSKSCGFAANVT